MYWASFNLSPVTSDFSTLSLPARSIRCRQPLEVDPFFKSSPRTCTVRILQTSFQISCNPQVQAEKSLVIDSTNLCDRLLRSFRAVEPTALFACPISIKSNTSEVDLTGCKLASGTTSPFGWEVLQIPSVSLCQEKHYSRCNNTIKSSYMSTIENYNAMKNIIVIVQKDIFFVQYHLIEDRELVHCISQPSVLPPHTRRHFSYLVKYQTNHLKHGNWHPSLASMC